MSWLKKLIFWHKDPATKYLEDTKTWERGYQWAIQALRSGEHDAARIAIITDGTFDNSKFDEGARRALHDYQNGFKDDETEEF